MEIRQTFTLVQCQQPVRNLGIGIGIGVGICFRSALVVVHIFDPGHYVVGLGPDVGVFQVMEQGPLPSPVAKPATATATITPPIAGSALRIMLNPTLSRATVNGRPSLGTMWPTKDCHDGLCKALP